MAKNSNTSFTYEALVSIILPEGILDVFEVVKVEEEHTGIIEETGLERSEAWLARKVHCDPGNFNRILKKPSMDMDLLRRISLSLNFNFCYEYSVVVGDQILQKNA